MNSISNQITKGIVQAIVLLTLIALLLFFIYKIQSVFVYIIISFVLTLMGLPLLKFLKSKAKFSNLWATIATLFLYILMIVGFISMFIPLITSQSESLSLLNTVDIEKNVKALLESVDKYLKIQGIHIENLVSEKDVTSRINLNYLPDILNGLLNTISSFGMGLASILFITFFFLKDSAKISRGLEFVLPKNFKNRLVTSWETIENLLSRYFLGIIIQLSIVFVLYIIVLSIFGVKNALIISFLCAVLNIIPYIGPLMGMILAAILTLISGLDTDFQSENLVCDDWIYVGTNY